MKQNIIKISIPEFAYHKVRGYNSFPNQSLYPASTWLGRLACLCLVGSVALFPSRYAWADINDRPRRILSFQNDSVASTVPGNGDVNPYGSPLCPRVSPEEDCLDQATYWCPTSMTALTSKGPAPRSSTLRQTTKPRFFSKARLP